MFETNTNNNMMPNGTNGYPAPNNPSTDYSVNVSDLKVNTNPMQTDNKKKCGCGCGKCGKSKYQKYQYAAIGVTILLLTGIWYFKASFKNQNA